MFAKDIELSKHHFLTADDLGYGDMTTNKWYAATQEFVPTDDSGLGASDF